MFSLRVAPTALVRGRLNAEAYSPDHLAADRQMGGSGLPVPDLSTFVTSPINNSIRDVSAYLDIPGAQIPMFRPADIADGWCSLDSAPRLPATFEAGHAKSRVVPGDIVIGIAGSIGVVGRVPSGIAHGNINGSSARLSLESQDAGYMLAYLSGRFGQSAMLRFAVGAVQRHLNLEDLPGIAVAKPDLRVRRYIGVKIQQAEALRERARAARNRALEGVRGVAGADLSTPASLSQRVAATTLGSRLDCNFYDARSIRVEQALRAAGPVMALRDVVSPDRIITNGVRGPDLVYSPYRLVRLQDCVDWTVDYSKCLTISAGQFHDNRRCRLRTGDVVVAVGGYIGNASFVAKDIPSVIGQHSAVLAVDPNGPLLPRFLTAYLNSDIGAAQFARYVSGTVQAGINLEDLREIEVPVPAMSVQREISDAVEVFIAASAGARALVTAARLLVEALIERKVSEAELIAAAADPAADRALLSRLTAAGLDAHGDPLFPDLDALQSLLATNGAPP